MVEPPLHGASLTVGPADWQILQQTGGTAALELAGVWRVEAREYRVEARLVHEATGAPVSGCDWHVAELLDGQRWRTTLPAIPAGGLYRLETRVWRDGCPDIRPTRGDYAHHLGVGDLWVIAGQSNASGTGLGAVEDPPTLGVHLFGNDEVWKLACHPLEDATRSLHPVTAHGVFQAHAPWLAFARRLQAELGYPIGLIPTALGGSPLRMWEPAADGVLYANLRDMVAKAGGRVRGVVWYQGESDAMGGSVETYGHRFAAVVAALRADLSDPHLPVLTAQIGRAPAALDAGVNERWTQLREIQRQAAQTIPGVYTIPALDLPMSDEVHVSAVGNVILGERFAQCALGQVFGRPATPPHIEPLHVERRAPATLRLTLTRPPAGWCRPGRYRDFRVVDEAGDVAVTAVAPDDDGWVDLTLARDLAGSATLHCHYGCDPEFDLRDRDQRPVTGFSLPV